jgi:hypothetical protein
MLIGHHALPKYSNMLLGSSFLMPNLICMHDLN